MKIKTDTKERLITGSLFLMELFRILMGTCLSVFVPHMCEKDVCTVLYNIKDNSDTYHRITLAANLFSLIVFLVFYGFETHRENWCIKHLDMDKTKSPVNLDTEIEAYPEIKVAMHNLNKKYKTITIICGTTQVINITMSVADIALAWAGFASVTPLLSYVMLILLKLQTSYGIATKSLLKERALSAYIRSAKIYNTIDSDFVKKPIDVKIEHTNSMYSH